MKWIKIWIIVSVAIIVLTGLSVFFTIWDKELKSQILQYSLILITGLGFFIAIYQYFNDVTKKADSYLDMKIHIESILPYVSIKTKVVNLVGEPKKITFAFLVISRQEDRILDVVNNYCISQNIPLNFDKTNDFYKLKDFVRNANFINDIGIIPLPFYYSENVHIGNESPGYTYTFNNQFTQLNPNIYSIRFFICRKTGYPRSTVGSLIINELHTSPKYIRFKPLLYGSQNFKRNLYE